MGIDTRPNATPVDTRSRAVSDLEPDHTPHGIPMASVKAMAIPERANVLGSRSAMTSLTGGCPEAENRTPKSPVTKSPSHRT